MNMKTTVFAGSKATAAERVARNHQKRLMLGYRRLMIWLNPEVAKALRSLQEANDHGSANGIISSLIAEAAKARR